MALINCPDCNKEISDKAPTCPGCGAPIVQDIESKGSGVDHLVTTQATSKALKAQQAIASALFLVGLFIMFAGKGGDGATFGAVVMVAGIAWYIAARTRIWWHHE